MSRYTLKNLTDEELSDLINELSLKFMEINDNLWDAFKEKERRHENSKDREESVLGNDT